MKKRIKVILPFVFIISIACIYVKYNFAFDREYENYVNENMVPVYGKVGETYGDDDTEQQIRDKGILDVHSEDLNHDRRKECLVIYTSGANLDVEDEHSDYKSLHIAVLRKEKGEIIETDNIVLEPLCNGGLYSKNQVYIKTNKRNKYIVMQSFGTIDATSNKIYILSVNRKGNLYLEKGLYDPGYSSGLVLYSLNKSADKLDTYDDYYDTGTVLYDDSENNFEATGSSEYENILKDELEEYGLTVKMDTIYSDIKQYILEEDSSMNRRIMLSDI